MGEQLDRRQLLLCQIILAPFFAVSLTFQQSGIIRAVFGLLEAV